MKKQKSRRTAASGKSKVQAAGVPSEFDGFEKLLELMESHSLSEIEWETQGRRIYLRKAGSEVVSPGYSFQRSEMRPSSPGAVSSEVINQTAPSPKDDRRKKILSPFVGTFFRSPSPSADPYVREGQTVKPGDVLCIVEAMKLMNEIECDTAGRIATVLVENGQPVEYGEPLFVLETTL